MISIIGAIVLGIAFTFVASQNPTVVPVNLIAFSLTLPLYVVAAAAFLAGIFVTLLFTLFDSTSAAVDIQNRDNKIHQFEKANANLQQYANNLKLENARLRDELRGQRNQRIKNFFSRIRHNLSI